MDDSITPDDLAIAVAAIVGMVKLFVGLLIAVSGFIVVFTSSATVPGWLLYGLGFFVMVSAAANLTDGWHRTVYYSLPGKHTEKPPVTERIWSNGEPVGSDG